MTLDWPSGERIASACPVCGADGPHPVLLRATDGGGRTHTLLRCNACTACHFTERTVPDYAADVANPVYEQVYLEQNAGIHHMTGVLFRLDDPPDGPPSDSMLDVGCGFGYPVDLAAKVLGWRAAGIDPAYNAERGARLLHADLRREYLTETSDLGEPFSLVMGSEVIEHIPDPYAFTALLRRWLRPGGTVVLTTPDAAMIHPGQDAASLYCMLSLGAHLVLYSVGGIEAMLRRAGFAHVRAEAANNTVIAWASDRPLRFRADADARHFAGYRAYLQHLVRTAPPGAPLWNGAAGRLFEVDAVGAPLEESLQLWAGIAAAWRDRFGFDLLRHRVPAPLAEARFNEDPAALLVEHLAGQPANLGAVLTARAMMERRIPGHTPESVLAYARPAYTIAVQTRRVLERAGLIDLALRGNAVQARLMMLDCLLHLAPELQLELLAAVAAPSTGDLAGRIDVPPDVMLPRLFGPFLRALDEGRADEADRLAPALGDLDAVVNAPHHSPPALLALLLRLGDHRLHHRRDPAGARMAFQYLELHASGWAAQPAWTAQTQPFLDLARARLAALGGDALPAPEAGADLAAAEAAQPARRAGPETRRKRSPPSGSAQARADGHTSSGPGAGPAIS